MATGERRPVVLRVLSRREVLALIAGGAAGSVLPGCDSAQSSTPDATVDGGMDAAMDARAVDATAEAAADVTACDAAAGGFFSDCERQALAAFADYVLPPDGAPGGARLG